MTQSLEELAAAGIAAAVCQLAGVAVLLESAPARSPACAEAIAVEIRWLDQYASDLRRRAGELRYAIGMNL